MSIRRETSAKAASTIVGPDDLGRQEAGEGDVAGDRRENRDQRADAGE